MLPLSTCFKSFYTDNLIVVPLHKLLYHNILITFYAAPSTPKYYNTRCPTSRSYTVVCADEQSHLLPVIYIFSVYFWYVCPTGTQGGRLPCTAVLIVKQAYSITGNHGMRRKRIPCFPIVSLTKSWSHLVYIYYNPLLPQE